VKRLLIILSLAFVAVASLAVLPPDRASARAGRSLVGVLAIYVEPSLVEMGQPVTIRLKTDSSLQEGSLLWLYVANGSPNTRSGGSCFRQLTLEKAEGFPLAALATGLPLSRSAQLSFAYRTPRSLTNSFVVCGYVANSRSTDPEAVAQQYADARFHTERPDTTQIPTISVADARRYARKVLRTKFAAPYAARAGTGDGLGTCRGLSRTRARCTVNWRTGSYHYYGQVTIWYDQRENRLWWFYSYVIQRTDARCTSEGRPASTCTKTFRVR
jgi:hypothetical protein